MGKSSSPPPAPDYTAAANATAAGNLQAAQYTTAANRVNQITPYGNLTYSQSPGQSTFDQAAWDAANKAYQQQLAAYNSSGGQSSLMPGQVSIRGNIRGIGGPAPVAPNMADFMTKAASPQWTATQTLTPAQQQILDQQTALNSGLLNTAQQGLNYANQTLAQPGVDLANLPQTGINPGQDYRQAMMQQLQPQITQQQNALNQNLANQGIPIGSEAWKNAQNQQASNVNNLLAQATTQGMGMGLNANQQAFQQQAYNQMQPINVINALRTGTQVQGPSYANVPQQANVGGADLLGASQLQNQAALGVYGAQTAQNNANTGAAAGIGAAALMML